MGENRLWEKILSESAQKTRHNDSTIIILGSKKSGKQSLIDALQRGPGYLRQEHTELVKQSESVGTGLHYSYLNAKNITDAHSDRIARVHVWSLDSPELGDLLDLVLKPEMIKNLLLIVNLDWEQPWDFLNELRKWLDFWQSKVWDVIRKLPLSEQDQLINGIINYTKVFHQEQDLDLETIQELPLPEGVLQVNLGTPIIITVNKADQIYEVSKNKENVEQTLDFILKHLREANNTYGATLMYTSTKQNINIDVLYNYIMHRLYGFRLPHEAQATQRETIFIPSGWDSANLLSDMNILNLPDKQYDEVVIMPKQRQNAPQQISCQSDQIFLQNARQKLEGANKDKNSRESKKVSPLDPGGEVVIQEQTAEAVGRQPNANPLQIFYQKLLEKGTGRGRGSVE